MTACSVALRLEHVHVALAGQEVLHGVSVAFTTGRWTSIVGPNGAGKSTLLKAMAGLLPLQGRVLIGDDVMSAGTAARESIALIKSAGAVPHAIAIALDRQEMATEKQADGTVQDVPHSAVQYVRGTLGMQVCTIAQLSDLLSYLSGQSNSALGAHLPKVQAYRDRYGV